MSYTPIGWKDYPNKETPITAASLNKMDQGIADAHDTIGNKELLDTADTSDLVAAINEVHGDATKNAASIKTLNNDLTEYCKVINGKLFAYNSETQQFDKEVSTGMPILDYANPLFTFDKDHLSYKAKQDCYIMGEWTASNAGSYLSIDGTPVFTSIVTNTIFPITIPPIKIAKGSTVTITDVSTTANRTVLNIYAIK